MIFSENRSPLFGIMRCRHGPGGWDATCERSDGSPAPPVVPDR